MGNSFIALSLTLAILLGACQPEEPQRASNKAQPSARSLH